MNKALPLIASGAILLGACSSAETSQNTPNQKGPVTTTTIKPSVDMVFDQAIPADKQKIIKSSGEYYATAYGCVSQVTVNLGHFATKNEAGKTVTVNAEGDPGVITYNADSLATDSAVQINSTTAHEMTHACQPDKPKILDKPIVLRDGAKVTGIQGFSLLVELPNGEHTKFTKIEEGVAEAQAAAIVPGYATNNERYFHVGELTMTFMEQDNITHAQLAGMVQSNDLAQYIGKIGDPAQPFAVNLVSAMDQYDTAFNS